MSVGNINKIEASFLVEEEVDFLIIGDIIDSEEVPSPELQDWLVNFLELCNQNKLVLKSISNYCVTSTEIDAKNPWINFFRKNFFSLPVFPPILQLKLKSGGLALEKNVIKSVKDYSNEFIEFLIDNRNRGR